MKGNKLRIALLLCLIASLFAVVVLFLQVDRRQDAAVNGAKKTKFHVEVILKSSSGVPEFWQLVKKGVESAADDWQLSYHVSGPQDERDYEEQIRLVQAAIHRRPDAIVLAACDYERLAAISQRAIDEKILLITLDSDVNLLGKTSFVGTDNVALGRELGRLALDTLEPHQKIAVIGHVKESATAMERVQGILENPGIAERIVDIRYCEGSSELARRQTLQLLQEYDDIGCFIGLNETSALGICKALDGRRRKEKIHVVSCDNAKAQIQYMAAGVIDHFIIQNPYQMGYVSIQIAHDALIGQAVPATTYIDSLIIGRDDLRKPEFQKRLFPFIS